MPVFTGAISNYFPSLLDGINKLRNLFGCEPHDS
ncbi:hypothetical protein BBR47_46010 [Brevibacillus brevis NBRC 100599]|uniref:Uncharacterized protein n=1 Tax=Brevibacillus brevis (strain 47 / JCM 6285 / NBRC 100599) TaxID=358681 RepID=C0ZJK3_BREBN|nr:hypothetical protein BBR47_46010 [Brevibacillus brevis NBRC 100599]